MKGIGKSVRWCVFLELIPAVDLKTQEGYMRNLVHHSGYFSHTYLLIVFIFMSGISVHSAWSRTPDGFSQRVLRGDGL
jgi:Ni,Fe-hydrogenase I cytochrome b subunit